jgi:hypothetical protein
LHLYYRAPPTGQLRNTEGDRGRGLGWKIDTRAHGGYVVAPGSILAGPDGVRAYRVLAGRDPAPLPGWLAERLTPGPLPAAPAVPIRASRGERSRYLDAAIHGETTKVLDAPASQRNAALYAAAVALGQLVAGGVLTDTEVTAALVSAAAKHVALGAYSERLPNHRLRYPGRGEPTEAGGRMSIAPDRGLGPFRTDPRPPTGPMS